MSYRGLHGRYRALQYIPDSLYSSLREGRDILGFGALFSVPRR